MDDADAREPKNCLRSRRETGTCDRCGHNPVVTHVPLRRRGTFCPMCCPACNPVGVNPEDGVVANRREGR